MKRYLPPVLCIAPIAVAFCVIAHGISVSAAPVTSTVRIKFDKQLAPPPKRKTVVVSGHGKLVGRVTFVGTPPKTRKVPAACAPGGFVADESLIVGAANGVANTFVYLPKLPRELADLRFSVPSDPVVSDQVGCQFKPHCLLVRVGQVLNIKNSDPVIHNSHLYPLAQAGFTQASQINDLEGIDFKYTAAEKRPVAVKCDFHSWMSAWHLPLAHPFAALSSTDGEFEIDNLPAGEYEFAVWHESAGYLHRRLKVQIRPDEVTDIAIEFPADKIN